jgi:hypothetical protein
MASGDVNNGNVSNGQEDGQFFDEGHSVGESFLSGGETTALTGDESVPDIQLLNLFCSRAQAPKNTSEAARAQAEKSWEPVRDWLSSHNAEEVRAAAEQRGESAMTAAHFACRNAPPLDVIDVFLSIAADTVQWPDSFGWLPIHYACACGAETDVIKLLAEAYPESKTTVDRRGRTPLHFALGNANPDTPASPDVVSLLSSTGAASYADDNGMLVRSRHHSCRSNESSVYGGTLLTFLLSRSLTASPLCVCIWCLGRDSLRLDGCFS